MGGGLLQAPEPLFHRARPDFDDPILALRFAFPAGTQDGYRHIRGADHVMVVKYGKTDSRLSVMLWPVLIRLSDSANTHLGPKYEEFSAAMAKVGLAIAVLTAYIRSGPSQLEH